MTERDWLDRDGLAAFLDVAPKTVSEYLRLARKHEREEGCRRTGDLPEPDRVVAGRHNMWKRTTAEKYRRNRPGRGAPGRPRVNL